METTRPSTSSEPQQSVPEQLPASDPLTMAAPSSTSSDPQQSVADQPQAADKPLEIGRPSTSTWIPVTNVSPLPLGSRVSRRPSSRQSRARGQTVVLTSSPYKRQLEERMKEADISGRKAKKVKSRPTKATSKPPKQPKKQKPATSPKKNKPRRQCVNNMPEADSQSDASCLYCSELYSQSAPGEQWIKCRSCAGWAHTECAGTKRKTFVCDLCL